MKQYYARDHKRMQLLDGVDSGDLWKVLGTKFPEYQILPDTNYVSYVKSNIVASLYTVAKGANILATSNEDKNLAALLNITMDRVWAIQNVGYFQFQAGFNATLFNVGYTQVGWDENMTAGSGDNIIKGNISFKNISPIKFMRDPFSSSLDTAGYCCTYDTYHKSVLENNPAYADRFKQYTTARNKDNMAIEIPKLSTDNNKTGQKDYYTLLTYWVKQNKKIYEIHVINNESILYYKEIKPAIFPIAELYCNYPGEKLVGSSPCAKIFANNTAYNIMQSIALTAEYRNQRPPKFINQQSGLNVGAFSRYGDQADMTFVVNGDATKAVHYQEFPQISNTMPTLQQTLERGIEQISGVDGRYTGRDTGSIITTGGTEEMLNRVTMIDTPKIVEYEKYSKTLTKLILLNLMEYCPKRSYFRKKPNTANQWETITVDFPNLQAKTLFDYEIYISSILPKNKASIAELANMLMEKQMQYQNGGQSIDLITPEEWLELQDLPFKERMLERMGLQRTDDAVRNVSQVLMQYSELMQKGANPEDAIAATAETLKQSQMGMPPEAPIPGLIPQGTADPMMAMQGLQGLM